MLRVIRPEKREEIIRFLRLLGEVDLHFAFFS
jgi:hypothetical protein